jgi:hypothetical protein
MLWIVWTENRPISSQPVQTTSRCTAVVCDGVGTLKTILFSATQTPFFDTVMNPLTGAGPAESNNNNL